MNVLVTGSTRGIGNSIVDEFFKHKHSIICPSRDELDLSNRTSVLEFIDNNKNDKFDVIINNAGINPLMSHEEYTFDKIEEVFMVNVYSPMMLIQGLTKHMKDNKCGWILNMASIRANSVKKNRSVYSASKAAVIGFTKAISVELAEYNILVNSVSPGYIETEMTLQNNSKSELKEIKNNIPVGRMGEPKSVASLVYFLCSSDNKYITGQDHIIDGGFTLL